MLKKGDKVRVKYEWLDNYNLKYRDNKKQIPYTIKAVIEDLSGRTLYKVSTFKELATEDVLFKAR